MRPDQRVITAAEKFWAARRALTKAQEAVDEAEREYGIAEDAWYVADPEGARIALGAARPESEEGSGP